MIRGLPMQSTLTENQFYFCKMPVNFLANSPHACAAVERINKNHCTVHVKAGESLENQTTKRTLFVFANETLLPNLENPVVSSFSSVGVAMSDQQGDGILTDPQQVHIRDFPRRHSIL